MAFDSRDPLSSNPASDGFGALQALRILGVLIIAASASLSYFVVTEVLTLLNDQSRVIALAEKVEAQSNVNQFMQEMVAKTQAEALARAQGRQAPAAPITAEQLRATPTLKAAYFAAWGILVLLLGLLARISFWGLNAGVRLALHGHTDSKRIEAMLRTALAEKASVVVTSRPHESSSS